MFLNSVVNDKAEDVSEICGCDIQLHFELSSGLVGKSCASGCMFPYVGVREGAGEGGVTVKLSS